MTQRCGDEEEGERRQAREDRRGHHEAGTMPAALPWNTIGAFMTDRLRRPR